MKIIRGKSQNINTPVIGRVSTNDKGFLFSGNTILSTQKIEKYVFKPSAIITTQQECNINIPCICNIAETDLSYIKDEDVIMLTPEGEIKVFWEINSPHNAIFVTEKCNCNCIMCPQPPRKEKESLHELNMRILKSVNPKKVCQIGFTGGEPTIRADSLIEMIVFSKKHFPQAAISILSNGRNFSDIELTRRFFEIGHSNLTYCIALYSDVDSEHDKIVGAKGSFYETIEGLHNLARFRQNIEIRVVIIKRNYRRITAMSEFIYRSFPFAFHIALMGMEFRENAVKNSEQVWIDPLEYSDEIKTAAIELHRRGMPVSIYNLPLCLLSKEIWRFSRKSISTWKNNYLEQCGDCSVKEKCGGIFETSEKQSDFIKPILI
jgi:His-Xaa-Ser system radical SAM maturase HxsC